MRAALGMRGAGLWGGRLFAAAMIAYLASPLVIVIIISFSSNDYIQFPPEGFSWRWYQQLTKDVDLLHSLGLSLQVAACAAVVGLAVGLPSALILVKYRLAGHRPLRILTLSPLILPEVLTGLAILFFVIGTLAEVQSVTWLTIGHCIVVVPFCVQFISAALAKLDPALEDAARTLGAPPFSVFWRVTVPAIKSGIVSAALLSFIFSFDNLTMSLFLGSAGSVALPVRMYEHAMYSNDLSLAAVSALLIYAGTAFLAVLAGMRGLEGAMPSSR